MMSPEPQWHKLSPWAMVAFSASGLLDTVKLSIYVLPVAFTGALAKLPDFWLPLAIALMSLHIVFSSVLQWLRFRFQLDPQHRRFRIRSGALFQKKQELPLDRIQNVRLEQPLPMRLIGKVNLVVETAGSGEKEAVLCAVTPSAAASLKTSLIPTLHTDEQEQSTDTHQKTDRLTRNPLQLFLHGFCFNQLAWLMLFLGPVFGQLDQYPWWEWLEGHPITGQWTASLSNLEPPMLALCVILLLALLYLILSLLSGLVSLLKHHPYQLTFEPTRLQFSGGSLHRMQDLLLKRRIQSLTLRQSPLARLIGIWSISLKQVNGSEPGKKLRGSLTIPAVRKEECQTLVSASTNDAHLPDHWLPISCFWRNLRMAGVALMSLTFALCMTLFPVITEQDGIFALLLGGVVMVCIELKWRQYGYLCQPEGIWLRQGVFGQQWHYLPLKKCQSVTLTQTPGLRKRGLANLTLFPASGKHTLPAITEIQAQELAKTILNRIRCDRENWL